MSNFKLSSAFDHFNPLGENDEDTSRLSHKTSSVVKKGNQTSDDDRKKSVMPFDKKEQINLNVDFMAAFPSVPGGAILRNGEKMISPKIATGIGEMTFDPERGKGNINVKLNDETWRGNINMMRSTQSHHYGRGFIVNESGTQAVPVMIHQNQNSGAGIISTLNAGRYSHLGNFAFPYLMGVF